MKTSPSAARILVATDNADDAHQIVRQLKSVFDNVRPSTIATRHGWREPDAASEGLAIGRTSH